VGPCIPLAAATHQSNTQAEAIAVGGVRTTAALLLKSKRRVRLFLLEDGDGDEEDEEDDEMSRTEGTIDVTPNNTVDVTMITPMDEEDGEDKENMSGLTFTT